MNRKVIRVFIWCLLVMFLFTSCGIPQGKDASGNEKKEIAVDEEIAQGMSHQNRIQLDYAEQFAIDSYGDGYTLITISDGNRFLVLSKTAEVPEGLDADITVIRESVQNAYLAATAAMDMFVHLDALECICLSGTEADGWYLEEAREAMEAGKIQYAGKYNAPDYEQIVSRGCDIAIESTMILHCPEVKEKLTGFGIPVFVDYASYESHPLGRMEWIKAYGVLTGREEMAEQLFEKEVSSLQNALQKEQASDASASQRKTVAFFYITSNGAVNVRKASDYIPKMIDMAGGRYVFEDLSKDDNHASSITMQMEEFYAKAKDADYLIYNSSIDGELHSMDELLQKNELLKDFKAVKDNKVWCTSKNLYQESMSTAAFTLDLYNMLSEKENEMRYLNHLE